MSEEPAVYTYKAWAFSTQEQKKKSPEQRIHEALDGHEGKVRRVFVRPDEMPQAATVDDVPVESRVWCAKGAIYLEAEA